MTKILYYNIILILTFESMCPLMIKLPTISIIVPPTNRRAASAIAFHGILTGGLTNCTEKNYFPWIVHVKYV